MKRNRAFGAAVVVAALAGSMLVGCSSDSEDTDSVVGTWVREDTDGIEVLSLNADGTCRYEAGDSRDTLTGYDACTYQVDPSTLTFLTSSYCSDSADKATYTYTLTNDQVTFTSASGDDKCGDRNAVMEDSVWTRNAEPVNPSTPQSVHSGSPVAGPVPWWNDEVFYEVFVRSFSDSDGNGVGDLQGLIGKLGYLDDLGVTALWLMPIAS